MNHRKRTSPERAHRKKRDAEAIDLLKEVFVCVSIPIVAFAFAYMTLETFLRLFLG